MTRPGILTLKYGTDALATPSSGLVTWASADGTSFKLKKDDGTESIYNSPSSDTYGATAENTLQTDTNGGLRLDRLTVGSITAATPGEVRTRTISQFLAGTLYTINTAVDVALVCVPLERDCVLDAVGWCTYVNGTSNSSNYWTLFVTRLDTGATITSLDTKTNTASTWARGYASGLALNISASWLSIYVYTQKTGSPGNLYCMAPTVFLY